MHPQETQKNCDSQTVWSLEHRRPTPTVRVGTVCVGSGHPVVIQTMTDTPTADEERTLAQTKELICAGAEMVRWTINDDEAARAAVRLIQRLRAEGIQTPIIGDFHFNGHVLLQKHKALAAALDKYRINPGNVGRGRKKDENFATIIRIAKDNNKPVRIGVNFGSLDPELLAMLMDENAQRPQPQPSEEVMVDAMIRSALESAQAALNEGLRRDQIILSVKMSQWRLMVSAYERLARLCDFPLHLGLTEAGGGVAGISASASALACLLYQGIGDTIRVSLTPQPNQPRTTEVEVCRTLLQAMGLRYFQPSVTACPGCGRTASHAFQHLAADINAHIQERLQDWIKRHPDVAKLKIAVMGCVVNGPGESRHADIGISLPGASEQPMAPVYIEGRKITVLKGEDIHSIRDAFLQILDDYIERRFIGESQPES